MLAIVTTANVIAFFDLTTNTKIHSRKFPANTPAFLVPSSPYLLLMGSKMEALEFRENNIIKRIEVSAVDVSVKNNEVYLAIRISWLCLPSTTSVWSDRTYSASLEGS